MVPRKADADVCVNATCKRVRAEGGTNDGFEERLAGRHFWRNGNQNKKMKNERDFRTFDVLLEEGFLSEEETVKYFSGVE